jgi:hypothetical protein
MPVQQPIADATMNSVAPTAIAAATTTTTDFSAETVPTVRDLLASGARVIEFAVSPDQTLTVSTPKGGNAPKGDFGFSSPNDGLDLPDSTAIAAAATPQITELSSVTATSSAKMTSASAPASTLPVTQAEQSAPFGTQPPQIAAVEAAQVQTTPVTTTPVAARSDAVNPALIAPQAKIAVADDSRVSSLGSGDKSSTRGRKNNALVADNKGVATSAPEVGTDTAKRVAVMSNNTPAHTEKARASDPFLSLAGISAAASNASNSPAAETAPASPTLSSHAAQAVREIRDIADGLWAVDRSSVEVRFNFTETEKLSVRVELKDGAVHTTFRTDSPELRDTLAREWQTQTPTAGSDIRPYRVADPVFGSGSSNRDQQGSFTGGDASRQQQQQQQQQRSFEQLAGTGSLSFSSGRNSGASTVSAPNSAQRILKTDTSVHLNAFA